VDVTWTPVANPQGSGPSEDITLRAFLSTTFSTPRTAKSSIEARHFPTIKGNFSAWSSRMHVSNHSDEVLQMSIRIPLSARSGYYNLATTTSQKDLSTFGAIIQVRR
jgi:putative heme iron utilization protein